MKSCYLSEIRHYSVIAALNQRNMNFVNFVFRFRIIALMRCILIGRVSKLGKLLTIDISLKYHTEVRAE